MRCVVWLWVLLLAAGGVATRGAQYAIDVKPDSIPDEQVVWSVVYGDVSFVGGNNKGRVVDVVGNADGEFKLEISIGQYPQDRKPFILGSVKPPETVRVTVWVIHDDSGQVAATTDQQVMGWLTKVNWVFAQVAMTFVLAGDINHTNRTDWLNIKGTNQVFASAVDLVNLPKNTSTGIRVIFANSIQNVETNAPPTEGITGLHIQERGIILATGLDSFSATTVAHEIGHACGLVDIYADHPATPLAVTGAISEARVPKDWGGGFYPANLTHADLIPRLLMYGQPSINKADIPLGNVYGLWYTFENGSTVWHLDEGNLAPVGAESMNRQPFHQ